MFFFSFLVPAPLGPAVITHHAGTKTAVVTVLHHRDVLMTPFAVLVRSTNVSKF